MHITHNKVTASVKTGMPYWYLFKHGLGPGTMPKGVNVLKVIEDGWKDYVLLDHMLTTAELNEYEIKEAQPPLSLLKQNGINNIEETYQKVNTSEYIESSEEYSKENIINSNAIKGATMGIYKFYDWYNGLTHQQKLEVDDYADTWNYPDYDDCDPEDLSALHKHFVSKFAQEDRSKPNFHVACFGNDYDELQDTFDTTDPKQAIAKWVQWQQKYPLDVMITGFAEGEQALRDYVVQHQDWIRQICNKYECPYDPEYLIKESEKPSRMKDSQYTDQLHPFGLG